MKYEVNISLSDQLISCLERVETNPHEEFHYSQVKELTELGVAYVIGNETGLYWMSLTALGKAIVKKHAKVEPITLVGGILTTKFVKKVGKKGKKYTVKVETEKFVEQKKAEVLSKVFQV